jgi:exopolyphosphatase/guanosine-5'-triphosphate,3'-diphosphate pyrophosphatase
LPGKETLQDSEPPDQRTILQVAALLHDVGRSKKEKAHHKATFKLMERLAPPLSWSKQKMHWAGIIARYHRGALPGAGQKTFEGLSPGQRQSVQRLAGILRLANAFDSQRDGHIQRLEVRNENGFIEIAAQGYSPRARSAESISAARHLLEIVYRQPLMVKTLKATK